MKVNIIKIGGDVVDDERMLQDFARDFAAQEGHKILVHGGGVKASSMQKRLGMEPVMIDGRRVTDAGTLEIVTMVYAGWCSKHIVASLQKYGCDAIGLCGADGNAIRAVRRPPVKKSVPGSLPGTSDTVVTDYGFVGDITPDGVNVRMLENLIRQGFTPVLCAITYDGDGNLLNTNADTVASSVAEAMAKAGHESVLTYCFEKNGVLYDRNDPESVISEIAPGSYARLRSEGRIADGMIPKLDNAFSALSNGVSKVVIKHASNIGNGTGTSVVLQAAGTEKPDFRK